MLLSQNDLLSYVISLISHFRAWHSFSLGIFTNTKRITNQLINRSKIKTFTPQIYLNFILYHNNVNVKT